MAAKKKTTKRASKLIPVIVCTSTRDVWYGHTTDPDATPLVLTGAPRAIGHARRADRRCDVSDLDKLADEVRALSTRDKITMARDLLDATASVPNKRVQRDLIAAILRMAIADMEARP